MSGLPCAAVLRLLLLLIACSTTLLPPLDSPSFSLSRNVSVAQMRRPRMQSTGRRCCACAPSFASWCAKLSSHCPQSFQTVVRVVNDTSCCVRFRLCLQYCLLVWGFFVVILFLALDGQDVDLAVAVLLPWSVRMIQV